MLSRQEDAMTIFTSKATGLALKIGIAGAVSFGAIATGFLLSRQGRHLVKEAWEGRRRSRLEDRVLERIWQDPSLGRRDIDIAEVDAGRVSISGVVRTQAERRRGVAIAESVPGVEDVIDQLEIRERERRRVPVAIRRPSRGG
jgi:hypothetical protein